MDNIAIKKQVYEQVSRQVYRQVYRWRQLNGQ